MSESQLERRRLADSDGNAPSTADSAIEMETRDYKARWHTVRKYDGRWERVKLYDIGQPGWFYTFINPRNPAKSRRRLGHLYWKCLKRFIMATNLLFFGTIFLIIGTTCHVVCDDRDRAWALQFCGALIFLPGIYASTILAKYVMCHDDYTWKMLPEPS